MASTKLRKPRTIAAAAAMAPADLIAVACDHAYDIAMDRGDYDWSAPPGSDHRLVVNMLRHCCTNYEDCGETAEAKTSAHAAIAAALPWLATECHRQSEQRKEDDELADQMAREAKEEARQRAANRRQWIKDSKSLIESGQISLGSLVTVRVRNHLRLVTVIGIASPKVKVGYTLKSGQPREDWVYASWCQAAAVTA